MECSLNTTELREEHTSMMKKQPGLGMLKTCPLFRDRQICTWCCFHIHDLAEPLKRANSSDKHVEYYEFIPKFLDRDWDDIWSTCSKCQNY